MRFIDKILNLSEENKVGLSGLTDELLCVYINKIFVETKQNIIVVTSTLFEANEIYQSLLKYNDNTFLFPMDDFLTSEAIAISPELKAARIETITSVLQDRSSKIVITHLMGMLRYLPPKDLWSEKTITIKKGDEIAKNDFINRLYDIGYVKETLVSKTGEIGNRGFVIDLFPVKEKYPIRIEFWGDEVESVRQFDLDTQLSLNEIEKITIYPYDEFLIKTEGDNVEKKQKNLPLYLDKIENIVNFLSNPLIIYKNYTQIKNAYKQLREEIFEYQHKYDKDNKTAYMLDFTKLFYEKEIYHMGFENVMQDVELDKIYNYKSSQPLSYNSDFNRVKTDIINYIKQGKTIVLCFEDKYQIDRFLKYFEGEYIVTNENEVQENKVNIIKKDINRGYIINDYVVFSSTNIFKDTIKKTVYRSNFQHGAKIRDLSKLNIGDFVVHSVHGIGIYNGIVTLDKNGIKRDYLQIHYRGSDKLYIPVEKIDLIFKYASSNDFVPRVSKLGGVEWQKTKLRIAGRVKEIAESLLTIEAQRQTEKGHAFSADDEAQITLESDFMFEETRDQRIATEEIKEDMEKEQPMDRLLCGDVGFGKTEVAFRAMFKAINDSKQVAYLCPTTILSYQQYTNAIERFRKVPIKIELLNRFTSKRKVKEILTDLELGIIDLIIGTHRLLSKDVKFKDLGLLVVDEEQRFGVEHKEALKQYKAGIDILTLSATPIPRTLQLSMAGIRNLSLIETPPLNRFPVQTYVLEENDHIIKDVIYKEISRGGQVFLLYNKIESIATKVSHIQKLVPEAKITYAHGRMSKVEIEERMLSFINIAYDVLICTTIIETGIDIPNVNTLIVIDADHFGLSQLYQIRGRVGRSDKIAYAYLMYKRNKVLNEEAAKRLNAIKDFTELGSGYSIALRDLSIRGAGNILGKEQAGFIESIGIELYLKMVKEEVAKIKEGRSEEPEIIREKPLLNVETYIDDNYVNNPELKIEIHRKINEIDSYGKLTAIKNEIEDRFGPVTESMLIYMYQEWFEKQAQKKNVQSIKQSDKSIEMIFKKEYSNPELLNKIIRKCKAISNNFSVNYSKGKIRVKLNILKLPKHWLYYIVDLVENI
jgi:transcription-repair coupling factor (superfamily II helicase)